MVVLLRPINIVQELYKGEETAIGKSVAGNTTKIHMAVDAFGLPTVFEITGGEVYDSKVAPELISKLPGEGTVTRIILAST